MWLYECFGVIHCVSFFQLKENAHVQLNKKNLQSLREEGEVSKKRCNTLQTLVSSIVRERSVEITPPVMMHPVSRVQKAESKVSEIDLSGTVPANPNESTYGSLPGWEAKQ